MGLEETLKTKGFASQRHKALLNIMFTAYQLKTTVSQILKDYALTNEQYNVLRILKGSHPTPLCVKDIATRTVERNSNTPRIIDRLEIKKLVKRSISQADKRETLIQITPAGINLLQAASTSLEQLQFNDINLTESDALTLNTLLDKLLPN